MCQYLAVESTHPSSPLFEDSSSSEATTPVTVQHMRPPKQKKHKTSPVPPAPIVLQLMEMGFQRKNIEFALKSLSGTTGASGVPGNAPIAQVFEMLNCHKLYSELALHAWVLKVPTLALLTWYNRNTMVTCTLACWFYCYFSSILE